MASAGPECSPTEHGMTTRSSGRLPLTLNESEACPRKWPWNSRSQKKLETRRSSARLELLIDLDLISRNQAICLVSHPDNGHQLFEHGVGHSFFLRRHRV